MIRIACAANLTCVPYDFEIKYCKFHIGLGRNMDYDD